MLIRTERRQLPGNYSYVTTAVGFDQPAYKYAEVVTDDFDKEEKAELDKIIAESGGLYNYNGDGYISQAAWNKFVSSRKITFSIHEHNGSYYIKFNGSGKPRYFHARYETQVLADKVKKTLAQSYFDQTDESKRQVSIDVNFSYPLENLKDFESVESRAERYVKKS